MSYYLKSAAFTPINIDIECGEPDVHARMADIAGIIHQQTDSVLDALSEQERAEITRHFVCSTMLELPFTSGALSEADLNPKGKLIQTPVTSFINTYECASWGYSLRYYLKQNPAAKYALVSILDANIMQLSFWQQNENWGKSGFGLCTFLLEIENSETAAITASCAMTYNATPEFATIIRKMVTGRDDLTLSLPFFPENIRQIFIKLLGGFKQLPDLHDRWGHCFGSDPWLNIICEGVKNGFQEKTKLLPCSIALNGYYCMAEVIADCESRFQLLEAI